MFFYSVLFLAVLDPRVGHTMNVLYPFIFVLCNSDRLFHGESCPRLGVVHPGCAWSSSPACSWNCSWHCFAVRLNVLKVEALCYFPVKTAWSYSVVLSQYTRVISTTRNTRHIMTIAENFVVQNLRVRLNIMKVVHTFQNPIKSWEKKSNSNLSVWIYNPDGRVFCANTILPQHVLDVSDNWSSLCVWSMDAGRRRHAHVRQTDATSSRYVTLVRLVLCLPSTRTNCLFTYYLYWRCSWYLLVKHQLTTSKFQCSELQTNARFLQNIILLARNKLVIKICRLCPNKKAPLYFQLLLSYFLGQFL